MATISGWDLKAGDKIEVNGHRFTVGSVEGDDPDQFRYLRQDPALVATEAIVVRPTEGATYYHLWRGLSYETWSE
jgi:hypothetical protein